MQKRKAISAIMVLVILWLPIGLTSIISTAENIPLTDEQLEKIGLNKIRLESGIGVMQFNLTISEGKMVGKGFLELSNTFGESALAKCEIITKLSPVDLDQYGNPRMHTVISNKVVFYPIPDASWISLDEKEATIKPYNKYRFYYNVNIPVDDSYEFDRNKGYLVYVNVKKTIENATGANIGIDYSYKLFIMFEGSVQKSNLFTYLVLIVGPAIVICVSVIAYKRTHNKSRKKSHISEPALKNKNVEKIDGGDDRPIFIIGGDDKHKSNSGGKK